MKGRTAFMQKPLTPNGKIRKEQLERMALAIETEAHISSVFAIEQLRRRDQLSRSALQMGIKRTRQLRRRMVPLMKQLVRDISLNVTHHTCCKEYIELGETDGSETLQSTNVFEGGIDLRGLPTPSVSIYVSPPTKKVVVESPVI
jgi:hypothetical protein